MKIIKRLSLVLSGFILGLGLSFSPQIYAATSSLLGSKVDKVIVVKLDKVELGKAITVDGTSYLPIRSLSNALDVGVNYTSSEINLTSSRGANTMSEVDKSTVLTSEQNADLAKSQQEQSEIEAEKLNKLSSDKRALEIKIKNKKEEILSNEYSIQDYQKRIDVYNKVPLENDKVRSDVQSEIDRFSSSISQANSNIDKHNQELSDLEAQLSALSK